MLKAFNLSRATQCLNFDCGCYCSRSILVPNQPWEIVPCFAHAKERERIAKLAETTWDETESKLNSSENLGK